MDSKLIQPIKFSELIKNIPFCALNLEGDPFIKGISYDSRQLKEGFLFVALRGEHTDGHQYLKQALANKAAALVVEEAAAVKDLNCPYLVVKNTRRELSRLASWLYGNPAKSLYVIGVTGTDGKSSTVYFIYQLLNKINFQAGFISTAAFDAGEGICRNPYRQSTPEAPEIQDFLASLKSKAKQFAVVEATSHGLDERTCRLADVDFDAAVFTNLAHEHLDFHKSWENYLKAKTNLFFKAALPKTKAHGLAGVAVVNLDDNFADYFIKAANGLKLYTYALKNKNATLWAYEIRNWNKGIICKLTDGKTTVDLKLALAGFFNVENFMAALLAVSGISGKNWFELVDWGAELEPLPGRMEIIDCGQPFRVIIDFAHTPQSFQKLLPLIKQETQGNLIAVFGSAGERDKAKRAWQGEIADQFADYIILTDEDPRGEDSYQILKDITGGIINKKEGKDLLLIADRQEAIAQAFRLAQVGDTVLLLGKGHEQSIIYKDYILKWNEKEIAQELLKQKGYFKD